MMNKHGFSTGLYSIGCLLLCASLLALTGCGGGDSSSPPPPPPPPPPAAADTIYFDANVVTLNEAAPGAQAIAITGTHIVAVGSNEEILAYQGENTVTMDLDGATILPGFIDPHSHLLGYAFFGDTKHWVDVSSINVYFKPPASDPRCTDPADYQLCFVPVATQDDVNARIASALAAASAGGQAAVYVANYDPARLGHSAACAGPSTNVGFGCPNLEDGMARQHLDALSADIPIIVTSQAGHVTFVNTPALRELNICGTDVADPTDCHTPTTNPSQEMALAQVGQLDEDLSFYSTGFFEGKIINQDKASVMAAIARGASLYARHGYTLAQEGAASLVLVGLYLEAMEANPDFPLTIGLMMYDANSGNFSGTVAAAAAAEALLQSNPNIFVAGLKSFADGSTEEYTADLVEPYANLFAPFTWSVFPQPYSGLPDLDSSAMAARAVVAHLAGYPLMIHQNGDQAIANSIQALLEAQPLFGTESFRDVVLHAPLIDFLQLEEVKALGDPVSFLMDDLYYWGLPMCQQILGPELATQKYALYPAASAENAGLHVTLHSDTPVTPPYPLFEVWVAATRAVQQPPWYPNRDPSQCPAVMSPNEAITIEQGIRAFTTNAAWQYGLENELGIIKVGFTADLVILSADPLAMEGHPDDLKTIRVLATVHHGDYIANPDADESPIWPD